MLLGEIKRKHTEHAQHEPSSSNEDSKNRSKQRKEQRERERERLVEQTTRMESFERS